MKLANRLLVVEDDDSMNLLLRDFLKGQGYAVNMATSVTGALALMKSLPQSQHPSLILSDIKLGALSGIDLCKKIGVDYPLVPVILFSVFDQVEKEALRSGAKRFLKKPFTLEKLAEVLEEELAVE